MDVGGKGILDPSTLKRYWRLMLSLEDDLSLIARYVEPVATNFDTTSVEISKLNSMACGGIEFFAKAMHADTVQGSAQGTSIGNWCTSILGDTRFSSLTSTSVEIESFGLMRTPWAGWNVGVSPTFWKAYNADKHDGFGRATFINGVDSTCALFAIYLIFYATIAPQGQQMPSPRTRLIGTGSFPALATTGDAYAASMLLGGM